ncbi:recombinase family protein [Clostridium sp. HMP27]|uniref:recombinase family protein n=1 Tax=Clostridium sp. HMP27 TaxID=1487921 RepID=UPI00052CD69C|nr:recombinase family protein [Clostridium sp. HMP27]KGK84833.1 hypothetical protein DP68_16355 [Clostridium sp. HMP27]
MKVKIPEKEEIVKRMVNDRHNYAAIYARESNPNVKSALEAQVITNTRYARENNLIIHAVYKEHISGVKHFRIRPEFKRLIEDAKKGLFKKIIVTKRDRLTRNFEDHLEIRKLFKGMDIQILYSNDVQLMEDRDYAANFIENMIMAIADLEPKNIRDRIYAGQQIKRGKGIYDKRPAFGFTCIEVSGEKYKTKYIKDGVRALVIKDIFEIYLDKSDVVEKPKEIIEKLKEKAEKMYIDKGEEYLEYKDIIYNLKNGDVTKIISRPIYTGQQTISLDYKYEDFKILYEDREVEVDEEYFHECINVEEIISLKQWIEAAKKWTSNNEPSRSRKSRGKNKTTLFNGLFSCCKCNTDIRLKYNTFVCEKKNCFEATKSNFVKEIFDKVITWTIDNRDCRKILKKIIDKLNLALKKLQKDLIECINKQGELVEEYIKDDKNKDTKENIKTLVDEKERIEQEIEDTKDKIIFLEEDFESITLPLAKSKFIDLLLRELEGNEQALLEIFDYKNEREISIGGNRIEIK